MINENETGNDSGSAIPVRIQRSRKHKQVSPNGLPVVYVGRPTKWGNPFVLKGDMIYIYASNKRKTFSNLVYLCKGDIEKCVRLYKCVVTGMMQEGEYGFEIDRLNDIMFWVKHFKKLNVGELKGKNLSCWCKENCLCHADILLELATNDEKHCA
jgi:hypothetical protein